MEDHNGETVTKHLNALSFAQKQRIKERLSIPLNEPLIKHNPRTHFSLPDYESGWFAWDTKQRSGQVWRQDARRWIKKFKVHRTKRAIVSPTP